LNFLHFSFVLLSGCVSDVPSLDKDSLTHLRNLSLVTWTANELIAIFSKRNLQMRQWLARSFMLLNLQMLFLF